MTNAELISMVRSIAKHGADWRINEVLNRAADALEAEDKRIKELESQAAFFDAEKLNYQENIEYRDERIKELEAQNAELTTKCNQLEAQIPKRGEWLRTDAFPHRVYCSCCYKTYVPNENWQIWQDDADNFGLPRNYCPNCGARMRYENQTDNV